MKTVYKYTGNLTDMLVMNLPVGAEILRFVLVIGFFGLIVSKHCVFSKEPVPIQSNTPVLDKFHKDVRERK